MDTNILVAVITGGFTSLIGISALLVNSKRLDDIRSELASLDARLNNIESHIVSFAADISRLKERVGIG